MSGHSGNSDWYTVSDVAEKMRTSEKTVYRICQEGQLKHKRCGRAIRVPADALSPCVRVVVASIDVPAWSTCCSGTPTIQNQKNPMPVRVADTMTWRGWRQMRN
ncbi:MAG: helix-turn-helix domain-containing protein [Deltaproteobacteria bacterium]|nr:helix-turn-helix domain-containing protein [Deltaproteobacteria bacterium]